MPESPAQKELNRQAAQKQKGRNLGPKIAAGAVAGTVITAALSDKKTRKKIGKVIKKGAKAVAGVFKKKEGEYMENPSTGKMERVKTGSPKVSNMSKNTKRALKERKK